MPVFDGLDEALRWIRLHRKLKQREVAQAAGITQAMLCSYEQGKRQPSLRTLERILDSLSVSLAELGEVLLSLKRDGSDDGATEQPSGRTANTATADPGPMLSAIVPDRLAQTLEDRELFEELPQLNRLLGLGEPLSEEEDAALRQLVGGFCRWIRVLHLSSRAVKS